MDYVRSERRLLANVRFEVGDTQSPPHLIRTEERSYEIPGDADTPQA